MHFDDRLDTVLRLPAMGKAFARTQYRQLLDILGRVGADANGSQIDSAYRKLAGLSETIPARERADILGRSDSRLQNSRLLTALLDGEPSVASAAIGTAQLSEAEWFALIPALPVRARGILRHRRDLGPKIDKLLEQLGISDRGLPPAEIDLGATGDDSEPLELVTLAPNEDAELEEGTEAESEISALLKRIDAFSRAKREGHQTQASHADAPRLPLEDQLDDLHARRAEPFDFATGSDGRVCWTDPAVAPMVVGMRLAPADQDDAQIVPTDMMLAMRHRQPLRHFPISIRGAQAVSGDWLVDAAPRFDPGIGGFVGYVGRFRRPAAKTATDTLPEGVSGESDRIRQILHELRTPANAIQISAEIIQQNLFGPTPHEYRAIAAMIASDTAYVLAGFDELERLAKLEGEAIELDEEGTCNVAAVVTSIVDQLDAYTAKRESGFAFKPAESPTPVAMAEEEVERMVWRLLAVLAGEANPNQRLALSCELENNHAVLRAALPAVLAARSGDEIFSADFGEKT
ncbi:MAG: sensor histidine kinase, partial [Novosphingobium sp.]|nr:sensor histidine kinase [Novosphingobium sp.]